MLRPRRLLSDCKRSLQMAFRLPVPPRLPRDDPQPLQRSRHAGALGIRWPFEDHQGSTCQGLGFDETTLVAAQPGEAVERGCGIWMVGPGIALEYCHRAVEKGLGFTEAALACQDHAEETAASSRGLRVRAYVALADRQRLPCSLLRGRIAAHMMVDLTEQPIAAGDRRAVGSGQCDCASDSLLGSCLGLLQAARVRQLRGSVPKRLQVAKHRLALFRGGLAEPLFLDSVRALTDGLRARREREYQGCRTTKERPKPEH